MDVVQYDSMNNLSEGQLKQLLGDGAKWIMLVKKDDIHCAVLGPSREPKDLIWFYNFLAQYIKTVA